MIIGGRLPEIYFRAAPGSESSLSTYTFSSVSIGAADASRLIVVAASYPTADAATATCKVGSISGTVVPGCGYHVYGAGAWSNSDVFVAQVPSGTSADIVLTSTATCNFSRIAVWSVYYARSATPTGSVVYKATGSSTVILDVNTLSNGVGCAFCIGSSNGMTWSGATSDFGSLVAFSWAYGASFSGAAASSPRAVRANTSPDLGITGQCVSFR